MRRGGELFPAGFVDILSGEKWVTPAPHDLFVARPVVEGDTILLATEAGNLWRVHIDTGDWIWKDRKTNGRVIGGLAADGRAVYVPCLDSHVYAFDMNSGSEIWSTPVEGRLDRALSVTRRCWYRQRGRGCTRWAPARAGSSGWHRA